MPKVVDAIGAKLDKAMEGKSPDELRKLFNIAGDFTKQEENQVFL